MSVYTGQIQEALTGAIDTTKLAEAWQALHPKDVGKATLGTVDGASGLRVCAPEGTASTSRVGSPAPVSAQRGQRGSSSTGAKDDIAKAITPILSQFLDRASKALTRALTAVLAKLYTEGWVLGQQSAQALVNGGDVDWGAWKPGDHRAAAAIAGPGLKQLLDSAGIRIKSIAATRLQDLADVLEATLASDVTHRQPLPAPLEPSLSVSDLARQLRDVLDRPERAELVATTEIARAQAEASRTVYRETGRTEVEISTAEDDKVCPVCDAAQAEGAHPLGRPPMVPIHPRCFPAGTLVSGPRAVAATGRHYEGDLVTVVFAVGDEVAVTPNHPVLTPAGWVPAGDLQKGDRVFRARDGVERAVACPDDEQVVRRIEDVAGALTEAGSVTAVRVPVAAEDFHGDGSPGHDVDVVAATRRAEGEVDAPQCEDGADLAFVGGAGLASLGQGDSDALGLALSAAPAGRVGSVEHGGPAGLVSTLPAQAHGLRSIAGSDVSLTEHAVDGPAADAVAAGEFQHGVSGEEVGSEPGRSGAPLPVLPDTSLADLAVGNGDADASDGRALADALAGTVSLDQIRDLRRVSWSGHVYNLETVSGWYFANGIIAHNCRCAELPVLAGA